MENEIASDTGAVATDTESTFDMDSAVAQISAQLFPDKPADEELDGPAGGPTVTPVADTPEPVVPEPVVPTIRAVPKSWPKEMHEHWGKVDPKVQEYWETRESQMLNGLDQYKGDAQYGKTLREVMTPFEHLLRQHRLEPHQAVQSLMVAHQRLTDGPLEQRRAAYDELGRNLGLTAPIGNGTATTAQPSLDPAIQALQTEFQGLKQSLTAREQADYHAAQQRVTQEVEAFAADAKAHPYFQEVSADITALLKGGVATSLQDAYERAVRMNPVTYAKEVTAAQQAEVTKQKENDRLNALKAKTAASTNVKNRDTKRAPTEPVGTMEDTIRETMRQQRARTLTTP